MPLLKINNEEDFILGIWKVEEDESTLISMLNESDSYTQELSQFNSSSRRIEWLAVRVLLQNISKGCRIMYQESGRPFIEDYSYNISISHTCGYVAVILHSTSEVGVDIEHYSTRVNKVIARFIRMDESPSYYKGDVTWSNLLHWSAKETAFKILDSENVDFLNHLFIQPFHTTEKGMFILKEFRTEKKESLNIHYEVYSDFVITWCVK